MKLATMIIVAALAMGTHMFAGVGVTIHWRSGYASHPEPGLIVMDMATDTPHTLMPGALAHALPYEGVHIRIFRDRIMKAHWTIQELRSMETGPLVFAPEDVRMIFAGLNK